jgi:hypothetical protein
MSRPKGSTRATILVRFALRHRRVENPIDAQ